MCRDQACCSAPDGTRTPGPTTEHVVAHLAHMWPGEEPPSGPCPGARGRQGLRGARAAPAAAEGGGGRRSPASWRRATTHLESFISICCRISCLSSSVLLGKIFLSSNSCLLGRFLSFTARSSFLHFLGSVPGSHRREGTTRKQVLVKCRLVDLVTHLLEGGVRTRATGAQCQPGVPSSGGRGGHGEKGRLPPTGHAFCGQTSHRISQASGDGCPGVLINGTQSFF